MTTQENYTVAVFYSLRSLFIQVLSILCICFPMFSQSDCTINVPDEPAPISVSKSGADIQNADCQNSTASWSNLNNLILNDSNNASVSLGSNQSSNCLVVNNFRYHLPDNVQILGLELVIEASSDNPLEIDGVQLTLNNEPIGENKASENDWPRNKNQITFGDNNDLWNLNLTPADLRNQSFGISLQLSNPNESTAIASMDELRLVVHYIPLYSVCDHDCITFFVDEMDGVQYDWQMPDNFHVLEGTQVNHIINIVASDDQKGVFELCLDINQNSQTQKQCCRTFMLENCEGASVGNLVWNDQNGNGVQDNNEPGLANVVVNLFDESNNLVQTTTTNANGNYQFSELERGYYYLEFLPANDFVPTTTNGASVVTNLLGFGTTDEFNLQGGEINNDLNAGFFQIGNISGLAWEDILVDNLNSEDDNLKAGVEVSLFKSNGEFVSSTQTNDSGLYQFNEVLVGEYYLVFQSQDRFQFVSPLAGDSSVSSSVTQNINTGSTNSFAVVSATTIENINVGYVQNVSNIAGVIWCDEDRDGFRSSVEERLVEVEVRLFTVDGQLVNSLVSNGDGSYQFDDIPLGSYYLQFELQSGKIFTTPVQDDHVNDSDVESNNGPGTTSVFEVTLGGVTINRDAGQKLILGEIRGVVWNDADFNGTRAPQEETIPNWEVSLLNLSGETLTTTLTDESGNYRFEELIVGIYILEFERRYPYLYTEANIGFEVTDSDVLNQEGQTSQYIIESDGQLHAVDAGVLRNEGNFLGEVWCDEDCDGIRDAGEVGVPEVTVTLHDVTGQVLSSTTTNENGEYFFGGLSADKYYLRVSETRSKELTIPNVGNNENVDSDITHDIEYGSTGTIFINAEIGEVKIDAGLKPILGDINGLVWDDVNYDGQRQDEELLISGLTVQLLLGDDNVVASTTTDQNGAYAFNQVLAEDYQIRFLNLENFTFTRSDLGSEERDSDVTNISTGTTGFVSITESGQIFTIDAGIVDNVIDIFGKTWCDNNFDGLLNEGDSFVPNHPVELFSSTEELVAQTTSDINGNYSFENVPSGSYYVAFGEIDLKTYTIPNVQSPTNINSQITGVNGGLSSDDLLIEPAQVDKDLNGGFVLISGSLKGLVWEDIKVDGVRFENENLIPNIPVSLIQNGEVISTTVTNEQGEYRFENVISGAYYLLFDAPEHFIFTLSNVGDDVDDSDVTNTFNEGSTVIFEINTNGECLSNDAGIVSSAADIKGTVWCDENRNGLQEEDEKGIGNLSVNLHNAFDDSIIQTVNTVFDGNYFFPKVGFGDYYLSFERATDKVFTQVSNIDAELNSDVTGINGFGTTNTFEIAMGDKLFDFDAGQRDLTGSINGVAWEDTQFDGIRSSSEPLVSGVTINLYNDNGDLVASTQTNESGAYSFAEVPIDIYILEVESPECFTYTLSNVGSDDLDSDVTNEIIDGSTAPFEINVNNTERNFDVGFVSNAANISGILWCDENSNGLRNANEAPVANTTISLYRAMTDEFVSSTTSNESGNYLFSKVPMGMYFLRFDAVDGKEFTTPIAGVNIMNSDIAFSNGDTEMFMIRMGDKELSFDGGYAPTKGAVTGLIWDDMDFDGIRESEEYFFESMTVALLDEDGNEISTTFTDQDGSYSFADLDFGAYSLKFNIPEGYIITVANNGNEDTDSDVTSEDGFSENFEISASNRTTNIDLGLVRNAGAIMGVIWCDDNGDGLRDSGESGLANINVNLFDANDQEIQTVDTDENGLCYFGDIEAGAYYIQISEIDGKTLSPANVGFDDNIDSDITNARGARTSDLVTISAGNMVNQLDAGFTIVLGTVSGRVWRDEDLLGVQDSDIEEGITGVPVTLFSVDGNFESSTVTTENGSYIFNEVPTDSYYLRFGQLADLEFTFSNVGPEDTDSDVSETNGAGTTDSFIIDENNTNFDLDAGYISSAGLISGVVWQDTDEDGLRDTNEDLLAEVKVTLFTQDGQRLSERFTTPDGVFTFTDISTGMHYLVVEKPEDSRFTVADQGEDENIDSDITELVTEGSTDNFILLPGERITNFGAGVITTNNGLTGVVWEDLDGDGVREDDEPLVEGIRVSLFDGSGAFVSFRNTDNNGAYIFSNIDSDFYYVKFEIGNDFEFTRFKRGFDDILDSDVTGELGRGTSDTYSIRNNETISGVNAGIFRPTSIAGEIWIDQNENNFQDNNEELLANTNISLMNANSDVIVRTSAVNGEYLFRNLMPGTYRIGFTPSGDYQFITASVGDETVNSDIEMIQNQVGITSSFKATSGLEITDIDAGVVAIQAESNNIGNLLFEDLNGNGIKDSNENGLDGFEINLFNSSSVFVTSTTTSANGAYQFSDLPDGSYYIEIELPEGYEVTFADRGDDEQLDSDITNANGSGTSDIISLSGGTNLTNIDIGVYRPVIIGDIVFNDGNANGVFDDNENGINGLRVRLFNTSNQQIAQDFTAFNPDAGKDGHYEFSAPPGEYYVLFQFSAGLFFTEANVGNDDSKDSDVDGTNGFGTTENIILLSGQSNFNIDAGMLQEPSNLGDFIWIDTNGNGIQEDDESGINDVNVEVYTPNDVLVASTVTRAEGDSDGFYFFEDLAPGTYYLRVVLPGTALSTESNQGGNDTKDSDLTDAFGPGTTSLFEMASAETDTDIDGGIFFPSTIGDFVWEDINKNGVQDSGEPGVSGVDITVRNLGQVVARTETDQNGMYEIPALKQGTYKLEFDLPQGYIFTDRAVGSDRARDSDVQQNGTTPLVNLAHNVEFKDFDAGMYRIDGFVGGEVYHDFNADAQKDVEDLPIENVEVDLYNQFGSWVAEAYTDDQGRVNFAEVADGTYYLRVRNPSEFKFSDLGVKNQVNEFGYSDLFTLEDGLSSAIINASLYQPVVIRTKVWRDLNGDGIMSNEEPLLNDVPVIVLDENQNTVAVDITGRKGDGIASFDDLKPGNYQLSYQPLPEYVETLNGSDPTGAFDSDILATEEGFVTSNYEMLSTDIMENANAGFYLASKIGDRVWMDENQNGMQDVGEHGVPEIQINLYNGKGLLVDTEFTDGDGNYLFDNLKLGSYYLEYLVDNFSFTESAVSVNEGLDNDVNHRNGEGTTDFIDINPEELNTDIDAGLVFGVLAIDDASLSGAFMGDYNLLNISPVDQVGISEYVLERQAPKGLAFETIKIFNAGENDAYSFKDYKIENGTYYYRLREISESGFVAVSRIISLEVNMIEVEKADFVIYPNPAKDIVNLNFNQEVNWTRINVWSATGVLVKTIAKSEDNATQELTVNISDLPMGAYYLEVIDNKEETTRKLINVIR